MDQKEDILELRPNIFRLRGTNQSSHSYVIKGDYKNLLIDSGADENFQKLESLLLKVGLKVKDIDIIINTHEHFDHIGANRYFQDYALIASHRYSANKITLADRVVTHYQSRDMNELPLKVHLCLKDRCRMDLGNYILDVIHTPGHTSGSICLYEFSQMLLFTGDTVFAGGTLSRIAESGSIGDYINSIITLRNFRIAELYPGHGRISFTPDEDMEQAIINARSFLKDKCQPSPIGMASPSLESEDNENLIKL